MTRARIVLLILVVTGLWVGYAVAVEARIIAPPLKGLAPELAEKSGLHGCPVTLPRDTVFTPPAPYPASYPYAGRSWYGTESLWTAIPDDGQWAQLLHGDKAFWWREGYSGRTEPQPALWMAARRLDGEGRVQQDPPATNAYHQDFEWAMLSGFQVPTPGCWEITGHYGEAALTFVVWVEG